MISIILSSLNYLKLKGNAWDSLQINCLIDRKKVGRWVWCNKNEAQLKIETIAT